MVRIRLKRMGRRNKPAYRVTVVDGRRSRDGRMIEEVGCYDPAHKNPELQCSLKLDRIDYWLSVGAQPSDTVRDLIKKVRAEATVSV